MSNNFYSVLLNNGTYRLELASSQLESNYSILFPPDAPSVNMTFRWNGTALEWAPYNPGNDNALSSIGLTLANTAADVFIVGNSPLTANGNLSLSFRNQLRNTILVSPNNADGEPTFRRMLDGDLPDSISANRINGVLDRNTIPNGTAATSWQLASGFMIANNPTGLSVFGSNGSTLADLTVANLNVSGSINQSNVNELNVEDQWINLLAGFNTGSPTLNGGLRVRRGSQLWSYFQWSESFSRWEAGLSNNLRHVARSESITIANSNLIGTRFTFDHGLNTRDVVVTVRNNLGLIVSLGYENVDANRSIIRFDRVGLFVGNWVINAVG